MCAPQPVPGHGLGGVDGGGAAGDRLQGVQLRALEGAATSIPARPKEELDVTVHNDNTGDIVVSAVTASAGFDVVRTTCLSGPNATPVVVSKNGGTYSTRESFSPTEAKPTVGDLTVTYVKRREDRIHDGARDRHRGHWQHHPHPRLDFGSDAAFSSSQLQVTITNKGSLPPDTGPLTLTKGDRTIQPGGGVFNLPEPSTGQAPCYNTPLAQTHPAASRRLRAFEQRFLRPHAHR